MSSRSALRDRQHMARPRGRLSLVGHLLAGKQARGADESAMRALSCRAATGRAAPVSLRVRGSHELVRHAVLGLHLLALPSMPHARSQLPRGTWGLRG